VQPHGFVVTDCATSNCKACLDKAYPKSRDDYTECGLHTKESDGVQYAYWYPMQSTTQVRLSLRCILRALCCGDCLQQSIYTLSLIAQQNL
jgi:hypothetical protein